MTETYLVMNTMTYVYFLSNRALAHGIGHLVGSIEVGKVADLVVFQPEFFGSKPELIIKGGIIVWGQMGKAVFTICLLVMQSHPFKYR